MMIDSHQHYWKISRGDYGWLKPESGSMYRDYLPEHLRADRFAAGIDRTIVVQAAATLEETQYLLELCESEASLAGAVGWMDLASDTFRADLERLRQHAYFVGIRPSLPWDREGRIPEAARKSLRYLEQSQFPVDWLVFPSDLPRLLHTLTEFPGLKGVVDHLAKPDIEGGTMEPWGEHIRQISEFPNTYVKLSGMITEVKSRPCRPEDAAPYVRHILECFGPHRGMFGSDWPICLRSGDYSTVMKVFLQSLPEAMSESGLNALLGETAAAFYKLNDCKKQE